MPARWSIVTQETPKTLGGLRSILLSNRGLTTPGAEAAYFTPSLDQIVFDIPGIKEAKKRIGHAIQSGEKIIVYSDYDADGICGVAVLWRALHRLGGHAMPFVPHREHDGYGLNPLVVSRLAGDGVQLLITVDCGITSYEGVEVAKKHNIDVIITDHHVAPTTLPAADVIVHDTNVCGAGVAWKLAQAITEHNDLVQDLDLVALATIADMVPLCLQNRVIATHGIRALQRTKNIGIRALLRDAGLQAEELEPYHLGHILAPRINALGRLGHAMDALRLLCTGNKVRANRLASLLGEANNARRELTMETIGHARSILEGDGGIEKKKIIILGHESWHQGIIGLVAGRLAEWYARPVIIMSRGAAFTKGSCRSIPPLDMIETLRSLEDFFVDVGGHPMAAGFTIATKEIPAFEQEITERIEKKLHRNDLVPVLSIDCELPLSFLKEETVAEVKTFAPFGIGNTEPLFCTRGMRLADVRFVGREHKHIKLSLAGYPELNIIGFGKATLAPALRPGDTIDLAYTLDEDTWGGKRRVQLTVRDLRKTGEAISRNPVIV